MSEDRTTQGKIVRYDLVVRWLLRIITIIVTGPAAEDTTSAEPVDGRTKQNWIFISDDNVTRSYPPLLCFSLQQALGPANPSAFLSLSLSHSLALPVSSAFAPSLPLSVVTRMHTHSCARYAACARSIQSLPTKRYTSFEYRTDYYSESIALRPTASWRGVPGKSNSITFSHNLGWNTLVASGRGTSVLFERLPPTSRSTYAPRNRDKSLCHDES